MSKSRAWGRDLLLPILVWVVTRGILLETARTQPLPLDLDLYRGWGASLVDGSAPSDVLWQYPPGAFFVMVLGAPFDAGYPARLSLVFLLIDALILSLLLWASWRRSDGSIWGPWVWIGGGLLIGPVLFDRFDLVPTLFAVAAVLAASYPRWAGALAGIGAMIKVWPVVALLAVARGAWRQAIAAFVIAAATVLAITWIWTSNPLGFLSSQAARGLQIESLWAAPFLVAYGFGSISRPEFEEGSAQITESIAPLIGQLSVVATIVVLAVLAWMRLRGRFDQVAPGDVVVFATLVVMLTSRVMSPQFNVWLLGALAAAVVSTRSQLRILVPIVGAALLVTQRVEDKYLDLLDGQWYPIGLQLLRLALLLGAAIAAWVLIERSRVRAVSAGERTNQSA